MKKERMLMVLLSALLASAVVVTGCGDDDDNDDDDNDGGVSALCPEVDGIEEGELNGEAICVVAAGEYTEDMTWTSDMAYWLEGGVFIGDDSATPTLTIEAGTTVYGGTSDTSFLTVQRGAKLVAQGTATSPIVFTSGKEAGTRARGDWGGLIINGKATLNSGDEAEGEGDTGFYGGTDDSDNSGVLSYVRVEYAGKQLGTDNELNGIAFQGVGSGTTIDHLHVHMGQDDGIEFFGGTAEFKYIITTGIGDDNLDWTDGWRGKGQFFVCQQYEDESDQGIEADNNGDANSATPYANPTLSNITLVGVPTSDASDIGMLLREGTKGNISNVIVTGFNEACFNIDHTQTWDNADDGSLAVSRTILDCGTNYADNSDEDDPTDADLEGFFTADSSNLTTDAMLEDELNTTSPNFAPTATSPAVGAGSAPSDSFFDSADYIGAIDPSNDWVAQGISDGWIKVDEIN